MPRGEHRSSILLSRDENEQVFSLIGPKCQSLATAVVQLFTTEGPAHSEWKKKDTGVLCLIKDNGKRSYFFRIYCLYRKSMIWEHEVYMQIEYKNPRPYLHTFEAEEYMTAFNFANEDEAEILKNILIDKIETRKHRREERRQRSMLATRANSGAGRLNGLAPSPPAASPPAPPPEAPPEPPPAPLPPKPAFPSSNYNTLKNTGKKPKRGKLTKADIGSPQDFKHISHVGWDADKGFEVGNLPNDELRSFFSMAGVSDTQLEDDDTREFIYDFIESHGGIDAVKENLHEVTPPRGVPTRAPPVPARGSAQAPAPPSRAPPPPPPARLAPPPSPPLAPRNPPPPRPSHPPSSAPPTLPPPPPPGPPPPPPPPGAPPPPPAPPAAPPPPDAAPDARAALMESIRSGSTGLKRVEVNSKPPPSEDNRSNLLSEIRQGIELKSVSRSGSSTGERAAAPAPGGTCALAVALKLALDKRNQAIHSESDSDDSDNTTSDGEWDD